MSTPKIEPIKLKKYESAQSKYKNLPVVPFRIACLAPSGSGKTVLISNIIMSLYDNVFSNIYIFSQSIHIDPVWNPVKKYIDNLTKNSKVKEQHYFDFFDDAAMTDIINTQNKIIDYLKQHNQTKVFNILIVVDDFSDDPRLRYNANLNSLFTRGRHSYISTIISSQSYHSISSIIRINVSDLIVFKLQNNKDLESVTDAVSALVSSKKIFLDIYETAVNDQPYSFLYIKLKSDINNMFYIRFDKKIIIND